MHGRRKHVRMSRITEVDSLLTFAISSNRTSSELEIE